MRIHRAGLAVFVGLVWAPGRIGAAPTTAPAAAKPPTQGEKFVRQYYGKLIDSVEKTPAEDDDLTVARQLLVHANDASTSEDLRLALAKAAIRLAAVLQSKDAADLTKQAMELIETTRPMSEADKAVFTKDLADRRLARAQAMHRPGSLQRLLAVKAVVAHIAFMRLAKLRPALIPEAEESLKVVRALVFRFRLTSLRDQLKEVEKLQRWFKARQQALQGAKLRLAAAEKRGDPKAIQAANRQLADVYLEYDGDLAAAAKYLAAAGDPRKDDLAVAAAFQVDPQTFKPTTGVKAAETLARIAQTLTDLGRQKLAECALELCKTYLDTTPAGTDAAKATLLVLQLEKMLGLTPDKKLLDRLTEAYGGLRCRLRIVDAQRVRVAYDFDSADQLADFSNPGNVWKIGMGALAVKAGTNTVTTVNKLRFRADRPVKLSFLARGKQHLEGRLYFYPTDATAEVATFRCAYSFLRKAYTRRSSTIYTPDPRGGDVPCITPRMFSTRQYRIDIGWDGQGTVTWLINGKSVGSATYELPDAAGYATVRCGLSTSNSITYFGEMMIEGEVILDPRPYTKPKPPPKPPTPPGTKPKKPPAPPVRPPRKPRRRPGRPLKTPTTAPASGTGGPTTQPTTAPRKPPPL